MCFAPKTLYPEPCTTISLPNHQVRSELTTEWQAREAALRSEAADQRQLVEQLTTAGARTADYIRNMQAQLDAARAGGGGGGGGGPGVSGRGGTPEGSPSAGGRDAAAAAATAAVATAAAAAEAERLQRELTTTKEEAGRMAAEMQAQVGGLWWEVSGKCGGGGSVRYHDVHHQGGKGSHGCRDAGAGVLEGQGWGSVG